MTSLGSDQLNCDSQKKERKKEKKKKDQLNYGSIKI